MFRKAKVVPLNEAPTTISLSKADWARLLEALDAPPAPNDELRALLAEDGPKGDNKPFKIAE